MSVTVQPGAVSVQQLCETADRERVAVLTGSMQTKTGRLRSHSEVMRKKKQCPRG